ncbi:MAG TPA: class I SAM-dependent methyltransferase [Acidimicrobiales bacterium]|nr:class I SAM-dependent methyltransferase [Acidimicrobiales bacterium]
MLVAESRSRPNQFARRLFSGLPAQYDRLAEVLSMGQNRRWRRAMVDPIAACRPGSVLDVATGPAGVALQLADRTDAHITGMDLSPDMLGAGAANVRRRRRQDRVSLLIGRGEELPFGDGTFDALTFTYLLRYVADPAAAIAELARVVRPGGVVANLEFHVPPNPFWRAMWVLYTRVVLPIGGLLTGGREWFRVGRFLGPSITEHYRRYPLEWHVAMWREAGIEDVEVRLMSLGGGLVMWGRRR